MIQDHVKRDLIKVLSVIIVLITLLLSLRFYDTKTNKVNDIGKKVLDRYIR